jgi:hypothetical protein
MTLRFAGPVLVALLASACATRPLVTVVPEPANHAWWLRARFEPRATSLDGVPVRAVNPAWCVADVLTPADFDAYERADGRDPWGPDAARYSVPGPHVDGRATRVELVAYRECAGPTGTAMLLVVPGAGTPRVLALQAIATPAAYAMLDSDRPGHVRVVHCQDCDAFDDYRWDPVARRWSAVDPPDDAL